VSSVAPSPCWPPSSRLRRDRDVERIGVRSADDRHVVAAHRPERRRGEGGLQGYKLWANQINASGGLLGRQLKLDVLDDGFDPNQTGTDYTRLISQDKVDLLLGTFSSLLNAPASAIAARQQMLYVEPSGGAASLFTVASRTCSSRSRHHGDPAQPVRPVGRVAAGEPTPDNRAYVTQDDPSASPAIAIFKTKLQALGVTTVYNQTYDPSTSNFDTIAAAVAHTSRR